VDVMEDELGAWKRAGSALKKAKQQQKEDMDKQRNSLPKMVSELGGGAATAAAACSKVAHMCYSGNYYLLTWSWTRLSQTNLDARRTGTLSNQAACSPS
jgi:hypothetical protein